MKAAVPAVRALPGERPRARAGDALDRRGDGLGVRPADRVREGGARRRAAAADIGHGVPLRARRTTSRRSRRWRRRSPGSGFKLVATGGTARDAAATRASRSSRWRRSPRAARRRSSTSSAAASCDLVVNTPFGGSLQRTDGYLIREAALVARVPCITTISGAAAAVHAIANARTELALSLQERIDVETRAANGH